MARRAHIDTIRKNVMMSVADEARMQRIRDLTNSQTDAEALRLVLDRYYELMRAEIDGYEVVCEPTEPGSTRRAKSIGRFVDRFALERFREKYGY